MKDLSVDSGAANLQRIFIGGTGRSGTTILCEALGCNKSVYSLPFEARFITDPDGLTTLIDALTVNYSPVHAREALSRFECLMRFDLNRPNQAPFLSYDLASYFGEGTYWRLLEDFINQITDLDYKLPASKQVPEYLGGKRARIASSLRRIADLVGDPQPRHRVTYNWPDYGAKKARYFSDRKELIGVARSFVDKLFMGVAEANGKETWCEKTPQNLFKIFFLWEMFPGSRFIHIKRDPRGVAFSMRNQRWGPDGLEEVCCILADQYRRWLDISSSLESGPGSYLEVKLEDLATCPKAVLRELAQACLVEPTGSDLPDISLDKVDYWKRTVPKAQIEKATRLLSPYIQRMGYVEEWE